MLSEGTVIGSYKIMEKIGAGGGGTVYKAYHLNLQKFVVVKRINDSWANVVDSRKEADIIKNLKHQYLPQAYDFLKLEDGIYTVMDYVSGLSVDKYLKNNYRFTQQHILYWMKQAAEALVYLHGQKPPIIHSDIKPANIMINLEGNICLIDFNVSLTSTPDSFISATSRGYASPEQYLNIQPLNQPVPGKRFVPQYNFDMRVPLDQRSDIYSLGATIYHMITLQHPPRYPEMIPEIPDDFEGFDETLIHIVNKMTRYDPRERYQSAERLLKDLNNIKKLDKRYVRHKRARLISNVVFPVIMVGAALLSFGGYFTMQKESDEAFAGKISVADNYVENKSFSQAEQAYNEAMDMRSESILPYLGIMKIYTEQFDFETAAKYGKDTLAAHTFKDDTEKDKADFYYILGNSYFEQENYTEAVKWYEEAVELNKENAEYYRDYAIALARNNNTSSAKSILSDAKHLGLDEASVVLVEAEIAYAENDSETAIRSFKKAIEKSSNSNLSQRASLYLNRIYYNIGHYDEVIDNLVNSESLFNESRKRVAKLMIADAYKGKAEHQRQGSTEWTEYSNKAISYYEQVMSGGSVKKMTKFKLATVYQYVENYVGARQLLNGMAKDYPDDASVYARLAMVEFDIQAKYKTNDYKHFKELYDKAEQLNKQNSINGNDVLYISDMRAYMDELKEKGYF